MTATVAHPIDTDRTDRLVEDNRRTFDRAIRDARAAVHPAVTSDSGTTPELLASVTRLLHVPLRPVAPDTRLRDALRHHGIRFRRVRLEPDDLTGAPLPVIAFAGDGSPLVVPPGRAGRTVAGRIDFARPALLLYPPLPTTVSARSLTRYALTGSASDLRLLLAAGLGFGLLSLFVPASAGTIIPQLMTAGSNGIWWATALLAVMVVVTGAALLVRSAVGSRIAQRLQARLEPAVWDRLLRHDVGFFRRFSTGELVQRSNGIAQVRQVLSDVLIGAALSAMFSIGSLAIVIVVAPMLGLVLLLTVAVAAVLLVHLARRQQRHESVVYEAYGEVYGLLYTLLRGIDKVHAAGREVHAFARWASVFRRQKTADAAAMRVQAATAAITATVQAGLLGALIVAVACWAPTTSVAALSLAATAAGQIALGFGQLGQLTVTAYSAGPILRRLWPILEPPEKAGSDVDPGRLDGVVELSEVSFRYPGADADTVDRVSLRAEPGALIAVVGPSGAGKSTLIRLLLGFEQPCAGTISYGSARLDQVDQHAIRRQLGTVLQHGRMLRGTLRDNIAGPETDLADAAVWRAAELAGIDGLLRSLPMGLNTRIGETAEGLSGGQVQRILLARALVREPRVLLLDEATSALDNRTQADITARIAALDCTRIVVAHRLSTIRQADRIYLLHRGAVAASGTFDELSAHSPLFRTLIDKQVQP